MIGFFVNIAICAGVSYNIHRSFKGTSKSERKFFKHYFISMAFILALDNMFAFLLYRIPYYNVFKLILLLWLSVTYGTGPHFIYNVYIKNIDKLFEGDIDAVITNLKGYFEDIKEKYYAKVKQAGKGGELGFDSKGVDVKFKEPIMESSEAEISQDDDEKQAIPENAKDK